MRLYLSSFGLGDHPVELVRLAGPGARVAVIANAVDAAPADVRRDAVDREAGALAELGLLPDEVDLRDHTDDRELLRRTLDGFDVLWLRGGNVFVLRHVLRVTGADDIVVEALRRDAFVYAGYSAGPCVLAPSLRGLELCDDVSDLARLHGAEPTWEGLGVLETAFVPHLDSPGHPETEAMGRVLELYRSTGVPHVGLRDGQAMVVEGEQVSIV
jgi:dipeptidase E